MLKYLRTFIFLKKKILYNKKEAKLARYSNWTERQYNKKEGNNKRVKETSFLMNNGKIKYCEFRGYVLKKEVYKKISRRMDFFFDLVLEFFVHFECV